MRVIVCGGRAYKRPEVVTCKLHVIHAREYIRCLAQGGAEGVDQFARTWAETTGVNFVTYHALWHYFFGKRAGPIRNAFMLQDFRPDLVIAFPGGAGTKNMVELARKAGVEVEEVTE